MHNENPKYVRYSHVYNDKLVLTLVRQDFDVKNWKDVDKVYKLEAYSCIFPNNEADFSAFTNCREIVIFGKNQLRVVKWPPKIEYIRISRFSNIKIPLKCDQYQYLREFRTLTAVLDDYNIDFAHCYRLRNISIHEDFYNERYENMFDGEKITLPPKNDGKHRMKQIPINWAFCLSLEKLELWSLREVKEIPIEFTYNPELWINISNLPHIPHISFLPIEFWDCTQFENSEEFMYDFDSFIHPRKQKNIERYKEWEKLFFEEYGFETTWTAERIKFMDYALIAAEQIKDKELRERFIRWAKNFRPKFKLKSGYELIM
ncbi:MAG: hypothetical protein K9W44_13770 [Candidatus Lokiarchaeota archaeon]|nr:hypothetical protein [Candidatus Harpocratesius repetitus]